MVVTAVAVVSVAVVAVVADDGVDGLHVPHNFLHWIKSAAPSTPSPHTLGLFVNAEQTSAVSTHVESSAAVVVVVSVGAVV